MDDEAVMQILNSLDQLPRQALDLPKIPASARVHHIRQVKVAKLERNKHLVHSIADQNFVELNNVVVVNCPEQRNLTHRRQRHTVPLFFHSNLLQRDTRPTDPIPCQINSPVRPFADLLNSFEQIDEPT